MVNKYNKMTGQKIEANLYDLNYPLYVVPVKSQAVDVLHIPGVFEYKELEPSFLHTLHAYKEEGVYYVYDAIPINLWHKQVCHISYEERRKKVIEAVYSYISQPKAVQEASSVLIDNPAELIDYCDNLLTQGFKSAKLYDKSGHYVFGQVHNGECLEITL
jgi:hypothetical protein